MVRIGSCCGLVLVCLLLLAANAEAWVYVPGAIQCGEFYRLNRMKATIDFRPHQNSYGDWVIVCRGKAENSVTLVTGLQRPDGTVTEPTWNVSFVQAQGGAGPQGQNLQPGQCAFPDRGIGNPSITNIFFEKTCNALVSQVLVPAANGVGAGRSGFFGVNISQTPLLPFQFSNNIFSIYVRQEGNAFRAIIDPSSRIFER